MLLEYRVAIEVVLGVLIAFYALRFSRSYPHLLALSLMSTAILTSGWVQGAGYVLFDELLLLALTVGAITSPAVRALGSPLRQPNRLFSTGFIWPAALLFYLAIHSLYGAVSFGDWRLIRWPVLYIALFLAWYLLFALHVRDADKGMSTRFLAWVATAYFGAYLLHWIILEVLVDIRWEAMQAVTWSGSTYALFPILVALPLVLTLLKSDERPAHRLAYLLLSLVSLCSQLYSSRAAFIVLLLLAAIALVHLPWRRAAKVAVLVLITQYGALSFSNFLHLGPDYGSIGSRVSEAGGASLADSTKSTDYGSIGSRVSEAVRRTSAVSSEYGGMVVESLRMPYAPRVSDADRHAHMVCAVKILYQADSAHLLLGYGQDRHKSVLTGCQELHQYLKQGQETIRSTAFTAFVVNYGLIGIILFTLVMVANIRKLLRNSTLPWITTLPFYVMALGWGLLTDYRDNVLVYLVLVFNAFAMISPRIPYQTDRAR